MKKLLIALVVLLLLLAGAVLVGPSLIDWNAQKPRIAAEVEKAIGRDIEITGDVGLRLLPAPALQVDGLKLANLEGGSEPVMASVEAVDLRVALWPLLSGAIQVQSLVLERPRLLLEVLADGRANWRIGAPRAPAESGAAAPAAPEAPAGEALTISLDRVVVRDGTLVYRDAAAGREERIEALDAEVQVRSLSGPFEASGTARLRGQPVAFDAALASIAAGQDSRLVLELRLPEASNAALAFDGTLRPLAETPQVAGSLTLSADNAAALAGALAPAARLPAALAQPLSLRGQARYDGTTLRAEAIKLALGPTQANGSLSVTPGAPLLVAGELDVPRLDLDALLAVQAGGGGGQGAGAGAGFALPRDVAADLRLDVDALIYRGQVVRQTMVSLALADGRLELRQALALLPGGADATLTGSLSAQAGRPRFVGRLEAAADNLRALLGWLGVEVSGVSGERLRRMNLTMAIDATPASAQLRDIDLALDTSRVTGGVAVALGERLGLGIGLSADRINLDAYLPPGGGGGGGQGTAAGETDGAAALLGAVDANLDLRAGQVTYAGNSFGDVQLDGTLAGGVLSLRALSVGDLAGGTGRLSGTFRGLPATPEVADGRLALSMPEAARLARLLGQPADSPLARLQGFQLDTGFSGTLAALALDAKLEALGGEVGLAGRLDGLPAAPALADGRVTASGVSGARLAAVLGQPAGSPLARLGRFGLEGSVAGNLQAVGLDAALSALDGRFTARGRIERLLEAAPGLGLAVGAEHPDLPRLLTALLGESPINPGSGALSLSGQLAGTPETLTLSGLAGRIGPTEIGGTLTYDASGAKPKVTADLSGGTLALDHFLGSGGGGGQGRADPRWSRAPIDAGALAALDAEARLRFEAVSQGGLQLDDVLLEAGLAGGRLDLRKLTGTLYGGALSSTGSVVAAAGGRDLEAGLSLNLIEADLGRLLRAQADFDRVSGPVTLNAALSSRGVSEAELVSRLAGQGTVDGRLTVQARGEEQVGGLLLGLLGQQVSEVRGLAGAVSTLLGAFAGAPADLAGSFTVRDGVATTEDTTLTGRGAVARVAGTLADLPAWSQDLTVRVFRGQGAEPYVVIGLAGPLDRPNPRVGGAALRQQQEVVPGLIDKLLPGQRRQQPAPDGTGGAPAPSQTEPSQTEPSQKEKVIQDIIKGLTGGGG